MSHIEKTHSASQVTRSGQALQERSAIGVPLGDGAGPPDPGFDACLDGLGEASVRRPGDARRSWVAGMRQAYQHACPKRS